MTFYTQVGRRYVLQIQMSMKKAEQKARYWNRVPPDGDPARIQSAGGTGLRSGVAGDGMGVGARLASGFWRASTIDSFIVSPM